MSNEKRRPHPTARAFFDALDQRRQEGEDNRSDFVKKQTSSLGWRSRYSQAHDYPVSMAQGDFTVRQVQRGEIDGTYGTGATVWPASMVLLKYLERHAQKVSNKTVVDLGAGTGVTSLAAALLGAKRVVCTDGIDSVVTLAQDNVRDACSQLEQQKVDIKSCIHVTDYWWGSGKLQQDFDVVLIADCVLPKLYPIAPLVDALDELMRQDSVAIFSYEHRHYADYHPAEKFRELAEAKGFKVKTVPTSDLDPVYSVDDIQIWEVTRC